MPCGHAFATNKYCHCIRTARFDFASKEMSDLSQSAYARIEREDLAYSSSASETQLDLSARDDYQTVNEISVEVRALIASWESSGSSWEVENDQLFTMQSSFGTLELPGSMPPPQRYRRISKNAFKG